jgi:hypothetical protein
MVEKAGLFFHLNKWSPIPSKGGSKGALQTDSKVSQDGIWDFLE